MSPRTEEQFEKIREEKKTLILRTALELFATEGYHISTISKIAKQAGISKGLIYNYYSSKEEVLEAVLKDGFLKMAETLIPDDGLLDTKKEFAEMIDKVFESIQNDTRFWKLYYTLFFQQGFEEIYKKLFNEAIEAYDKIICEYYKIRKVKNPEIMAHTFMAATDGIALAYILAPEHFPIKEIKNILIEKFS